MSRRAFGWSLPPGVTTRDIDSGGDVCSVCRRPSDVCVCPECPYCGVTGDPACYTQGHESDDVRLRGKMHLTRKQAIARAQARIAELRASLQEEELYLAELSDEHNDYEPMPLVETPRT